MQEKVRKASRLPRRRVERSTDLRPQEWRPFPATQARSVWGSPRHNRPSRWHPSEWLDLGMAAPKNRVGAVAVQMALLLEQFVAPASRPLDKRPYLSASRKALRPSSTLTFSTFHISATSRC